MEELIFCIIWALCSLPVLIPILKHGDNTISTFGIICITTIAVIGGPIFILSDILTFLISIFITDDYWEKIEKDIEEDDSNGKRW